MEQQTHIQPVETGLVQAGFDLIVETRGAGFVEITAQISRWLEGICAHEGLLTVFVCHTSASLTIQENADADVCADLLDALDRLAPQNMGYRHRLEGPDDMPAHIRSMITSVNLSVPVRAGDMVLGTWQGLYLIEHRKHPHTRKIALHFQGSRLGS